MMDGLDDSPDLLSEEGEKSQRSVSVDLTDNSLVVDISDALSEKEKVKFTVHTRTTMKEFEKSEYSVVRQHEEFVWLHDAYVENENYAGILIPPAPPKPDFEASREKLGKLSEGEGSMTKEEFTRMKQELEAEYLAIFKKTVAMHEIFLCRIAAHPSLKTDSNFKVFLVYENELNVRGKNKKEILSGFFKNITKSADETLILSGQKDTDEFFEHEKSFITEYHSRIKDATMKSDKFTKNHKQCADDCLTIARNLQALATIEYSIGSSHQTQFDSSGGPEKKFVVRIDLCDEVRMLLKVHDTLEKVRKLMSRVACDEDLKLSDLLRYYMRDTQACKDLLYRRARAMANYENANKELDKARAKGKNVNQCEKNQVETREKFEKLSEVGKQELTEFKGRRVSAFRKHLIELGELEVKHSKAVVQVLKGCLTAIEQS